MKPALHRHWRGPQRPEAAPGRQSVRPLPAGPGAPRAPHAPHAPHAWASLSPPRVWRAWALGLSALLLAACAGPPAPDWQIQAGSALQRMQQALLQGNDRVATLEHQRARQDVAATGRPDLVARVELLRCAAWTASLQFEPCAEFERLRVDARPPELAYAAYLRGQLAPAQRSLLPPAQQPLALAPQGEAAQQAALQAVADPLSRLLAAALWLQAGQATPAALAVAVDTASAQGWRRPLLAWLRLQQQRARAAGDVAEGSRIGRRIDLVLQGQGG